jgi:hypothetical protein
MRGCEEFVLLYTQKGRLFKFNYDNKSQEELEIPKSNEDRGLLNFMNSWIQGEQHKIIEIKDIFLSPK